MFKHVRINDNGLKCFLCDLWVHKACENLSDETFKVFDLQNAETGQCFWACKSCRNYALKYDKKMRDGEKRVNTLEKETVPALTVSDLL